VAKPNSYSKGTYDIAVGDKLTSAILITYLKLVWNLRVNGAKLTLPPHDCETSAKSVLLVTPDLSGWSKD
jgi:hypothetical protein